MKAEDVRHPLILERVPCNKELSYLPYNLNGPSFIESKSKLIIQEPNFVKYIKIKYFCIVFKFTEYFRNATIMYDKGRLHIVIFKNLPKVVHFGKCITNGSPISNI